MRSRRILDRRSFTAGALLAPLVLVGCGGDQADVTAPPEISYGRDTCHRCGMIISDDRYAAALVAADGTSEVYDDVGEMLQSVSETGLNGRRAWVHDWSSRQWIDATAAIFIRTAPELTPMGTGYIAFERPQDAAAFASEPGAVPLTWEEVVAAS